MTDYDKLIGVPGNIRFVQHGSLVLAQTLRLGGLTTLAIVSGLVAALLSTVAVSLIAYHDGWPPSPLGWTIPAALVMVAVAVLAIRRLVGRRHAELEALPTMAIFDLDSGWMTDGDGHRLAPIDQVTLVRLRGAGSSSNEIIAEWPTGSVSLAKQTYASNSLETDRQLRALGLRLEGFGLGSGMGRRQWERKKREREAAEGFAV